MLKDTLREIVIVQAGELARGDSSVTRDLVAGVALSLPHALTIAGVRRCGKSTLLRQLITPRGAYCDFEDPKLISFSLEDFERLEQVFQEIRPGFDMCAFDEIQNVVGWERYVGRTRRKFIITGSNASLLSRELGTKLTGRHLSLELLPFSYREMLALTEQKAGIESFREYSSYGGFPEFLRYRRAEILQELFKDILIRDIAVRHGVRDAHALQELALYLISNVGKEFSYNKLANLFTFGSGNTIGDYVSHMEESYLLFTIPLFAFSLKRQRRNPRKVYGIDTGFCRVNSVAFSANEGQILENLVFLELRRRGGDIYYFKEKRECDFVVKKGGGIVDVIQVCSEIHDANLQRELAGLREAMQVTQCSAGRILTTNQEDTVDGIPIQPTWKWLMEKNRRMRTS